MLARSSRKAILRRGALLAALAGPFVAEPAQAQWMPPRDQAYRLVVVRGPGAEECPSAMVFSVAMHGDLRRTTVDPFGDLPYEGYLKVDFAREGSSWRVQLSGHNREGYPFERQDAMFPEGTCAQIVPKVATMAARMIEVPLAGLERQELPPPKVERVVVPPGPPPWDIRFGLGTELGWGNLPKVGLGGRIEFGLRRGKLSGLLELRQRAPVEVNNGSRAGFDSHTGAFVFGGCYHVWLLGACPLLALGWLNAQGLSLEKPGHATVPYTGLGGRAFVEFPLPGPVALRLETDPMGNLSRTRVTANFGDVLWIMPWFTWSSALKLLYVYRQGAQRQQKVP